MAFDRKAYLEYEKELYDITYNGIFDEEKTNQLFSHLLSVLPNNGKLYKYKSLKSFHLDELEEKYVWLSSAKFLNDNNDCAFNADFSKDIKEIVKYVLLDDNYRRILIFDFANKYHNKGVTYEAIEDCINCVTKNGEKIGLIKFKELCRKYCLSVNQIDELKRVIERYLDPSPETEKLKENITNSFLQLKLLRNQNHILSLTTSYKKDNMWAYYCNNKGVCVEYDLSKVDTFAKKKVFLNTYKVNYRKKKKISYAEILKLKLINSKESIIKADRLTIDQLSTKDKSWMTEDEWRVILFEKGNEQGIKIPVDIISAIYIDYSILQKKKTKQIIKYAKENNWNVYVRYFDDLNVEYRYETIEKTRKLIKEYSIEKEKRA